MPDETNAAPANSGAASAPAPAPEPTSPFYVVQQPVSEGNVTYLKNQRIPLTADRAKALGPMVRPWNDTYAFNADTTVAGKAYKRGDTITLARDAALRLGRVLSLPAAPQAQPGIANTVPQPPAPAMKVVPPATVAPTAQEAKK